MFVCVYIQERGKSNVKKFGERQGEVPMKQDVCRRFGKYD